MSIRPELMNTWAKLLLAEQKARSSKWDRLFHSPWWYPLAMTFQYLIYPVTGKEWKKEVKTFFGKMITSLPSGTDISLNGIKSHDSEIRLAKFLLFNLYPGDSFIDIGAHYGYFSLLASQIAGPSGQIKSIEASKSSYALLKLNTSGHPNIKSYNVAAGDRESKITFYEYPGPYAEYNTTIPGAYAKAAWRKKVKETINTIDAIRLDSFLNQELITEGIIKIDVEGGEMAVLRGMGEALNTGKWIIAMEYLDYAGSANTHNEAAGYLYMHDYLSYRIMADGQLESLPDIPGYFLKEKIQSDNIVFKKKKINN